MAFVLVPGVEIWIVSYGDRCESAPTNWSRARAATLGCHMGAHPIA
jgi:hypothetical protein